MKALNKETAPKAQRPERIIQFGEGNFLRAFVDWIIYNMNQKTDFNSNVVVVQPIDKGMVDMLNAQDDLYHVNLQGLDKGETINSLTMIDVISRALNPYTQNDEFMKLAEQPEMRFVISNTTEAGIAFDPACKLTDTPASSYPGKLTQLLYHRFKTFNGDKSKGLIIFPCELIFLNGHKLKETIYQFVFRQVQRFHQLVKHHFMDVLSDYRMLAGIAYNIYLRQIGYWRQYGMRSIQQGYFSFVVRFFRRNKQ